MRFADPKLSRDGKGKDGTSSLRQEQYGETRKSNHRHSCFLLDNGLRHSVRDRGVIVCRIPDQDQERDTLWQTGRGAMNEVGSR